MISFGYPGRPYIAIEGTETGLNLHISDGTDTDSINNEAVFELVDALEVFVTNFQAERVRAEKPDVAPPQADGYEGCGFVWESPDGGLPHECVRHVKTRFDSAGRELGAMHQCACGRTHSA